MNKKLFQSVRSINTPVANVLNEAGGKAYSRTDAEALAQLAVTGCFQDTFYVSGEDQLKRVLEHAEKVDPSFLSNLAIFARHKGKMKDMPAILTAVLFKNVNSDNKESVSLFEHTFKHAINSMKMLSVFVQMVRSNATGRKSFGTVGKRAISNFLSARTATQTFRESAGLSPSFNDILSMVHPKPATVEHEALYRYLVKDGEMMPNLPQSVVDFESFKKGVKDHRTLPSDVDWRMLTSCDLSDKEWAKIAENASWQMTRMNINTFARHNVFSSPKMTNIIASRLSDPELVKKANVLPYQLFAAYKSTLDTADVPQSISNALNTAMHYALDNVPRLKNGRTAVFVDVSGSMSSPITGDNGSATSSMRCIDVASLIAASVLSKNPDALIIPFDTKNHAFSQSGNNVSVLEMADALSKFGGGGTACHIPMNKLNKDKRHEINNIVMVSDNESWVAYHRTSGTGLQTEFNTFRKSNPKAKMMLIDLTPSSSTQATNSPDVINIGGWSDANFEIMDTFFNDKYKNLSFVDAINDYAHTEVSNNADA